MERLAAAFIRLGVKKLRLTGGEPLVRPGVMGLVERLGAWVASGELDELTLTTNGTLLARHAAALAAAGVRRVNVSLDTLDACTFRLRHAPATAWPTCWPASRPPAPPAWRCASIRSRMAGINDTEFDKLIRWCGDHDCDMALIEVMPIGLAADNYLPLNVVRARPGASLDADRHRRRHRRPGPLLARRGDRRPPGPDHADEPRFLRQLQSRACHLYRAPGALPGPEATASTCVRRCANPTPTSGLQAEIVAAIANKPAGHRFAGGRINLEARPMWQVGG